MNYKTTVKMAVAALLAMTGVSAAQANIIFTLGNSPLDDGDNVLFTDNNLSHSGNLIQGNFNGPGSGFILDFTSASGNGSLQAPSGGQARVEGAIGNTPLANITFGLEGATFTGVVLNPFSGSGAAILIVRDLNGVTSLFSYIMGNGENFVTINANNGQQIDTVTLIAPGGGFTDLRQVRMAGFESINSVPDGGATVMLLGAALSGIGFMRRRVEASV
jgi:hypothetical protein